MQLCKTLLKSQVEYCVSYSKSDRVILPQKTLSMVSQYTVNKNLSPKAHLLSHTHAGHL